MALNWGIVSAGKISSGFAKAISILPKSEHQLIAVAARDLSRAQEFAEEYSIPKAYGDYETLAKDPDVEVAYIGNLHPQHFEVSKLMLENGKHVLCEKPMTMNEKQTRQLIEIAIKNKKFLMEAIWSRCFPAYENLKKIIEDDEIGEVRFISINFGLKLNHVDRLNLKEMGGGTILDLGIYNLQFQQHIFGGEEPINFIAAGHLNEHGTDENANMVLTYSKGRTAVLSTHSCVELPNTAIIVGTKGTIKVPEFWCPTSIKTPTDYLEFDLPESKYEALRPGGMSYEAVEVRRCIRAGLLESPKITHAESIQLARWMDTARKQIGVIYKEDAE